jgi:Phosphotransferase enzyme family
MPELKREEIQQYLSSQAGVPVTILDLDVLGGSRSRGEIKGYGYGTPLKVHYRTAAGEQKTVVIHTVSPGPFGHENMSDRARELLWEYGAFRHLPRHVGSLDVSAIESTGRLLSLGDAQEFCLWTEYAPGECYVKDLERLRDDGALTELDLARADALCDYLVDIHKVRGPEGDINGEIYVRRIRELVGDGECIMGMADSYPAHPLFAPSVLERIEHLSVAWRWRLKRLTHRLRQVHGDFHPWNILFQPGLEFSLLDRSRGEFGDPADDVVCLTMNYLFFSLQRSTRLEGPLETLYLRFWRRYLDQTEDREMLQVVAPFIAFRGLVLASPVWYPHLKEIVRRKILTFLFAVLESDSFDPEKTNDYCEA